MPKLVNDVAVPRPTKPRGRYAHLLLEAADTDRAICFDESEIPPSGVKSIRVTAAYYGLRIKVSTVDGAVYVRVFSKGGGE